MNINLLVETDIDTSQFRRNLAHFIDQQKPDPLVRRQLQSLHLEWKHGDNGGDDDNNASPDDGNNKNENQVDCPIRNDSMDSLPSSSSSLSSSSFLREGTLTMIGEFVTISLHCKCTWMIIDTGTCAAPASDNDTSTRKGGDELSNAQISTSTGGRRCQMNFQFWVSTAFTLKLAWNKLLLCKEKGKDDEGEGEGIHSKRQSKMDRKEKKAQEKLRSGMVERMKKDVYIRRLFVDKDAGTSTNASAASSPSSSTSQNHGILLCEAMIQFDQAPVPVPTSSKSSLSSSTTSPLGSGSSTSTLKMTNLEERVYVAEEALEGVRRSLFSHMEDNISVMEFLLDLPFLPKNTGAFMNTSSSAHTGGSGISMTSETEEDTGPGSEMRPDVERGTCTNDGKNDVQSDKNKLGNMLAERVVMRVLEDVMFDQCEKEGEDELLEDLNIGGDDNGGGGGDGDGDKSDWIEERGRNEDNGSSRKGKKQKHKS